MMIWLDDDDDELHDAVILCNNILLQYTSTLHWIFIDSEAVYLHVKQSYQNFDLIQIWYVFKLSFPTHSRLRWVSGLVCNDIILNKFSNENATTKCVCRRTNRKIVARVLKWEEFIYFGGGNIFVNR